MNNGKTSSVASVKWDAMRFSTFFLFFTAAIVFLSSFLVSKWTLAKAGATLQFIGVSFLFLESILKTWIDPNKDFKDAIDALKNETPPNIDVDNLPQETSEQLKVLAGAVKSLSSYLGKSVGVMLSALTFQLANLLALGLTLIGFLLSIYG